MGVRSLHVVLQRLGDKKVMADGGSKGGPPPLEKKDVDTYYKIFCWNVLGVGSL